MSRIRSAAVFAGVSVFLGMLILLCFRELTDVSRSLEASDAPIFQSLQMKNMLHQGVFACASPATGLGAIGPIIVGDHTALFYYLLPAVKVEECLMAFGAFFAALFMFLFLRDRGYDIPSALTGGLALGFSMALLSIAKAGHTGKFTGIMFIAGSMWLMGKALKKDSFIWAAFAGYFMGLSLAQARDLSLIVGLGIAVFWIRELVVRAKTEKAFPKMVLARFALAGVIALITAWPVMSILMPKESGSASPAGVQQDADQKWEWATQWSLPSDELMKLIVPSYCGWDSWDQKAPYWGRMGRSYGWETTKQGFRNFTQTNEYIGVTVFLLALVGLCGFIPRWREQRLFDNPASPPNDTLFWAVLGVVSLMLAMGKYFPLYKVFYALPMMSSIRNPVKFMHIVCFALAMLSAQGVYLMSRLAAGEAQDRRRLKMTVVIAAGAVALFLLLGTIGTPWEGSSLLSRWTAEGFAEQIKGIKTAMMLGYIRSLLFASACFGIVLLVHLLPARITATFAVRASMAGLLVILVAWDLVGASRKYVSYCDPTSTYRSNAVIELLKEEKAYRTKFIPHTWGIFNMWNSLLVPYYFFKSTDLPAESRRSPDLESFYRVVGQTPDRLWKLMGVKHFVVPDQLAGELRKIYGDTRIQISKTFDLTQDRMSGAVVPVWATPPQKGQFSILQNPEAIPCGRWYGKALAVPYDRMMSMLCDPALDLDKVLLVDEKDAGEQSSQPVPADYPSGGTCSLVEYNENTIKLQVNAPADGWVFVNDYFDRNWITTVSDKVVPLVRANGVFRAVRVPAGNHLVMMKYYGNDGTFWVPIYVLSALMLSAIAVSVFGAALRMRKQG